VSRERRLGRGLEALLGRPAEAASPAGPELRLVAPRDSEALGVPVSQIDSNPYQPRRDFAPGDLAELTASLREHGLLQPIVVRRNGERFQVIAGERRLRAAVEAGWSEVPAHVMDVDDRKLAELAIVENLQRKDLNALEKAASFSRYLREYGVSQEELAGRLSIDRSTVANLIRLLELPDVIQDAVRKGTLTQGHARALLPLGDAGEQIAFMKRIEQEELSVRETESQVQEWIRRADGPDGAPPASGASTRPRRTANEQINALEQTLRRELGTRVVIRESARGRGKIMVHFGSHDEFERIFERLCNERPTSSSSTG
jgi:ParB family chromosome partitioning protein